MGRSSKSGKEYNLPADRTAKMITALGILIAALPISIFAYFEILSEPTILAVAASILLVPVAVYLYFPKKIVLKDDGIVIEKVLGSVEIPYAKIEEVFFLRKPKLLRFFGFGGFFGYFGIFRFDGDTVRVHARRVRDFVVVKADKTYLLAPENPEEFMWDLE